MTAPSALTETDGSIVATPTTERGVLLPPSKTNAAHRGYVALVSGGSSLPDEKTKSRDDNEYDLTEEDMAAFNHKYCLNSLQKTTTESTTREGGGTASKISTGNEAPLVDSLQVNAEATTSRRVTGCFETEFSSTMDGTSKNPSAPDHDGQVENHDKVAQSNDGEDEPPKKKRKGGGRPFGAANYTDEEVERLLKVVGYVLPTSDYGWETVKLAMQSLAPPGTPVRNVKSLKSRFKRASAALKINPLGPMSKTDKSCNARNVDHVVSIIKQTSVDRAATNESARSGLNAKTLGNSSVGVNFPVDASGSAVGDNGDSLDVDANALNDHDGNSEDGNMEEEAEKLSNSMVSFFEQFNAADGVILGKETLDSFTVRLQQIEKDVKEMKGAVESVNTKLGAVLSALQKP